MRTVLCYAGLVLAVLSGCRSDGGSRETTLPIASEGPVPPLLDTLATTTNSGSDSLAAVAPSDTLAEHNRIFRMDAERTYVMEGS